MKNKKIITRRIALTVSLIGIVLLMVLQFIWLRNAYKISEKNLKDKSMECLEEAIARETYGRKIDDKLGEIGYLEQKISNLTQFDILFQDLHIISKDPINLKKVDSLFSDFILSKLKVIPDYRIYLSKRKEYTHTVYELRDFDNEIKELDEKYIAKILDSTYTYRIREKDNNASRIILTKQLNSCQNIILEIINPAALILRKAKYVLIISIVLAVLIASILVYLLKSALRENRFVRFIKEYTHALTHDLRSPLNSIHLASSTLYQEGDSLESKKAKDYLRICKDQSKNMMESIDRILTVAKTEQTELIVNKKPLLIKPFLQEITRTFVEDNIHVKPIVVELVCELDDLVASIDNVLMGSVLNNLMDNAVKYSYESVTITVNAYMQGNTIHIGVKDDGMGIPANDLEAIFEHFNQGSLLERKRMFGYGIGLSFIKQVVQSHGGHIEVTSKVMEGSEFIVVLPA